MCSSDLDNLVILSRIILSKHTSCLFQSSNILNIIIVIEKILCMEEIRSHLPMIRDYYSKLGK